MTAQIIHLFPRLKENTNEMATLRSDFIQDIAKLIKKFDEDLYTESFITLIEENPYIRFIHELATMLNNEALIDAINLMRDKDIIYYKQKVISALSMHRNNENVWTAESLDALSEIAESLIWHVKPEEYDTSPITGFECLKPCEV